ncbi:GMC oxidoreductase [Aplosporella prunicola CBS 121167]|uniref:GMC oxidoreductase n=1 Tax=Aplosporella prunicola CBS 121167 TaxID=1176127 RepID=A0A6A6BND8_9PEZI|nr:GMC oxidoreductase [Aplosporella prunicola CBS 121167]KAF2144347.1 GMC oxidoreductase [Aplosporella prunicola CBS 121167]
MAGAIQGEFDFIVVGGGTAGNAVAGRLAENPKVSVLVVEAGVGNPQDVPEIFTPARAFELRGSHHDWQYETTFVDRPDFKRVDKPNTRGKVLGGSSCLNYYTWVRGSKATFDDWEEYGGKNWNWENTKHYFDKPATYHDDGNLFATSLKHIGTTGPIHVEHADLVPELQPFRDAMKQAWESKGHYLTDDIYNGQMHGLVNCVNSIHKGVRSTSAAYLTGKPNITLMHSSHTKQLTLDGKIVTGVTVLGPDGQDYEFKARKEVIVSQGVFETPKLLMLSGIGRAADLEAHGIRTVVDSPHVGQNLLDHPIMPHVFKLKDGYGLDSYVVHQGSKHEEAANKYMKDTTGPFKSGLLELVGFPRIDHLLAKNKDYVAAKERNGGLDPFGPGGQPHFEIDFVPVFASAFQWHTPMPSEGDYLTVIVDLLRPMSRNGEVKLKSSNALEQPSINLKYFENELDIVALREGVRFIDDVLMNGEGMKEIIDGEYPKPLPRDSDEEMRKEILEKHQTGFHPCGTCRLGTNKDQGVVDSELKVYGVDRLRVIDASVFPIIPDCRIQNAVYMVAEKGADIIKAAYPDLYT